MYESKRVESTQHRARSILNSEQYHHLMTPCHEKDTDKLEAKSKKNNPGAEGLDLSAKIK